MPNYRDLNRSMAKKTITFHLKCTEKRSSCGFGKFHAFVNDKMGYIRHQKACNCDTQCHRINMRQRSRFTCSENANAIFGFWSRI